jgi:WD40-like Beta Propeller Repeat
MKRFLTALAVALVAIFAVTGCNDYGNTFQSNTGAQITTLSPSNITAGSPSFTLVISGLGFVTQTYITWNGQKLTTADVLDSAGDVVQVSAVIPANLVATAGKASILTHNPFSGAGNNGLSNPLNFIINPTVQPNPIPLLQSLNPNNIAAGSAAFTMTLTGANFVTNSDPAQAAAVFWNSTSTSLPITAGTVPTSTQINVTVPASLVTAAGAANVFVVNPPNTAGTPPAGGGGMSSPLAFNVNAATATAMTAKAQSAAEETPAVSADGRYVAYTAAQGSHSEIFLRDTCAGAPSGCQPQSSLVSVAADGSAANDDSHSPSMSADGRYVAFSSVASNLVSGTSSGGVASAVGRQIYLRDTCVGAAAGCEPSTELISVDSAGQLSGLESILPSVSASGRFVAFVAVARSKAAASSSAASSTSATNGAASAAAANSANSGYRQIFVRDTCLGVASPGCAAKTSRISIQPGDGADSAPAAGATPAGPALSGDAKKIALTGSGTAVLFTQAVAVDDRVFVAALGATR